jgi:hypothetical protein
MKRRRRLTVAAAVLVLALATRTPGAGLFWILCGCLVCACWFLPDSVVHRSRELRWEAAQHRAAEGWPNAGDRLLIRLDRIYRGGVVTLGVFLILYGLISL